MELYIYFPMCLHEEQLYLCFELSFLFSFTFICFVLSAVSPPKLPVVDFSTHIFSFIYVPSLLPPAMNLCVISPIRLFC